MTRMELQEIDWDKGDKVTAQLGSLIDQGKCIFLLDCMIVWESWYDKIYMWTHYCMCSIYVYSCFDLQNQPR